MPGIKLLVTGFLVPSLAEGLQGFHKESTISSESAVLGADFGYAPLQNLCATAVSDGWVLLTRYSSPKAAPGELMVLRQSGATVLMLAPAVAEKRHNVIGRHLLGVWSTLVSEASANPGKIIEVPARAVPPPWRIL